jgi:hypothetical protein
MHELTFFLLPFLPFSLIFYFSDLAKKQDVKLPQRKKKIIEHGKNLSAESFALSSEDGENYRQRRKTRRAAAINQDKRLYVPAQRKRRAVRRGRGSHV